MEKRSILREKLFALIREKAYHEGPVKLASGKLSHYYIDARVITLSAGGAYLVGSLIFDLIKDTPIDALGGPTMGADPIVGAFATVSFQEGRPINTFIIRKTPKAHGRMLQVEGPELKEGSRVVLVDDVATTGGSLVDSIAVLKKLGIHPKKAIVIVDREEGAAESLAKEGCALAALFKASEFFTPKK